jgi:hypothetical protein
MGRHELPHERLRLENDVGDVEDGEKPAVHCIGHVQILLHASNFGIPDVTTIEESKQI